MFTPFSYDDVRKAAPPVEQTRDLGVSADPRDRALYLAILSLERIAGMDNPEGDDPASDALRNLSRIRVLCAEMGESQERENR